MGILELERLSEQRVCVCVCSRFHHSLFVEYKYCCLSRSILAYLVFSLSITFTWLQQKQKQFNTQRAAIYIANETVCHLKKTGGEL